MKILSATEAIRQIQQRSYSKQLLDFLVRDYNLKPGMVDTCYKFAKCRYDCPVRTRDPELREDVQKVRNHLERHLSGVMDLRYQIP